MTESAEFRAHLLNVSVSQMKQDSGKVYEAGTRYGLNNVVSNDGVSAELCNEFSQVNCQKCVVDCPFNQREIVVA